MSIVSTSRTDYGPSYTGTTNPSWVDTRNGQKQVPFSGNRLISLPYSRVFMKNLSSVGKGRFPPLGANSISWQCVSWWQDGSVNSVGALSTAGKLAYNRAYAKLRENLHGQSADILTLIRERKLLADMLYNRAHQVADLIDEVKSYTSARGNSSARASRHRKSSLRRIAAILSTTPAGVRQKTATLRRREGLLTTPAELILELRWGWGPLMSDVHGALTGLAEPIPYLPIYGSAGYPISVDKTPLSGGYGTWMFQKAKGQFRVKVGGLVAIDNSLTAAFERVGMTNVFQSLYETTPYSWLLDYFSSLGEVISSLDDELVSKLTSPYVVFYSKGIESFAYREYRGQPNEAGWDVTRSVVTMNRWTPSTIPRPAFVVHAPDLSPWRIATLASLVILKIKGIKKLGL